MRATDGLEASQIGSVPALTFSSIIANLGTTKNHSEHSVLQKVLHEWYSGLSSFFLQRATLAALEQWRRRGAALLS